jgi:hypothetical protein
MYEWLVRGCAISKHLAASISVRPDGESRWCCASLAIMAESGCFTSWEMAAAIASSVISRALRSRRWARIDRTNRA